MRASFAFVVSLGMLAGCAVETTPSPTPELSTSTPATPAPDPIDATWVVVVRSTFERRDANGSRWDPPNPGYHGCPETFVIDETARTITMDGEGAARAHHGAAVAISVEGRHPSEYYRNARLTFADELPHHVVLGPPTDGSRGDEVVRLRFDADGVRVDGEPLAEGGVADRAIRYTWNGTVHGREGSERVSLDVRENLVVRNLGAWADPLRDRAPFMCI